MTIINRQKGKRLPSSLLLIHNRVAEVLLNPNSKQKWLHVSMSLSREKVFKKIAQHQQELRDLGVLQLQLFGSAARNESHKTSDLDFVVQFETTSFNAYMDVKLLLEDTFRCSVDLVLADTIRPQLRDSILQEAIHAPGF